MELIELMVVRGGRQDFFVSGCFVAVATYCDSDRFVTPTIVTNARFLAPQPTRERRIDKTIGRPSSPKNALACTQSPPFEAFFGLQKAPKVPKWLKKRPEWSKKLPNGGIDGIDRIDGRSGGPPGFFCVGVFRCGCDVLRQ